MRAYDSGAAAYFATPPVNLIRAYHASLTQITSSSLKERMHLHQQASRRIKAIASQLGLEEIARKPSEAANGMTALYLPKGISVSDVLPRLSERGILVAGGR